MDKRVTNYKTEFIYTILKTNEVVNIRVDFNIDGDMPKITLVSPKSIDQEDLKIMFTSLEKSFMHRMGFDIKTNCRISIHNDGKITTLENLDNILN